MYHRMTELKDFVQKIASMVRNRCDWNSDEMCRKLKKWIENNDIYEEKVKPTRKKNNETKGPPKKKGK